MQAAIGAAMTTATITATGMVSDDGHGDGSSDDEHGDGRNDDGHGNGHSSDGRAMRAAMGATIWGVAE
jgi:hypothetical protein